MADLVIKNGNTTKTIPLVTSEPSKPYVKMANGYLPLSANGSGEGLYVKNGNSVYKAVEEPFALKFSSDGAFTLSVSNPGWDGTLEYSTDRGNTWSTWDGSQLSGSANQDIYLRGSNNTQISSSNTHKWSFSGKYIIGNIETLLDYQTVINEQHPIMGNACYADMFWGCTSLIVAPSLSVVTLTSQCYSWMFYGCTSLTTAPELPATTLAYQCYANMFQNCTSLTTAPKLPATTLAESCYHAMFKDCISLTTAPKLPATTLAESCYHAMFNGCTSLITIPELPATTLAEECYEGMFNGCTSLKMSTTQTGIYQYEYRIPTSGTGTTTSYALDDMFTSTGGTFTGTPTINTTYYTDHEPV